MSNFILLMKGGLLDSTDTVQLDRHMQQWKDYDVYVSQHGTIKTSEGLWFDAEMANAIGPAGGAKPTQETLTGVYHIETKSIEKAKKIAAKAPNIALGGTVEVREVGQ
jgi:hypothetical protein